MTIDLSLRSTPFTEVRLLADIGATYARFCIEPAPGQFEHVAVLPCSDHAGITEVIQAYLTTVPELKPRHGAVSIANPIQGDQVRMTNRDWAFSIKEVQQQLKLSTLLVVNNFTALAMALPGVGPQGRLQVGGGAPQANGVIGLLGPGTGLGVSGLIPSGDRWTTLATEGGHVNFAPSDEREMRVLQHAWKSMSRVSAERLISGPGIELIHQALSAGRELSTAEIVQRALQHDAACVETLEVFSGMLGSMASDVALTLGATGGMYVGGGIVPRLGPLFAQAIFRERFEAKGRMSDYVARIPTYVLTAENLVFQGISTLLSDHVPDAGGSHPLLERVRASVATLSPAERRVANFVLDNPRTALNDPIALIAHGAEVSQPTVIRFCRSLGFQGLADFKLKLGSGLTGTLPVQRTQVRRQDGTADLCAKVLDNTISAIVQFREALNVDAVDRAISLLREARRVEFYAMGNSAIVALDAQHKLFRFRISSVAHTDPSMHSMAAELLGPSDVAVFISSSGQPPELSRAAGLALERGAKVIAITASQSPLARKSTVCIPVEHSEDASTFVSMISRILHLLVVDMMSVGVAVRRLPSASIGSEVPADGQQQPAPGVLISHVE
ncbi:MULTISPECIES: glucokinase [unclassified Rhizobacter]|uniref:glucokinase n=1 Tax=unclassified Rhizobacter TaxID=2640088 RepID=UPI000700F750|nr:MULTISPECIES: glucokinase [unclassified Rhizobacter]KQU70187.1 RpiR family transcriptional regulator [Rhizobacter sp. Root29]KQW00355.1 RpiR family transcriptional regulator [Rhizobacter sp. Root1238]KRB08495.1 RpiR family transcriptional regulator [Rhizobacter sp. Root16D2]